MSDLTERLRGHYVMGLGHRRVVPPICIEAAECIEQLEALREAIQAVVDDANICPDLDSGGNLPNYGHVERNLVFALREALTPPTQESS